MNIIKQLYSTLLASPITIPQE